MAMPQPIIADGFPKFCLFIIEIHYSHGAQLPSGSQPQRHSQSLEQVVAPSPQQISGQVSAQATAMTVPHPTEQQDAQIGFPIHTPAQKTAQPTLAADPHLMPHQYMQSAQSTL
jgi:hypothetical protein